MPWREYRECCRQFGADAEVAFCPTCGNTYIRCHAFTECGGLVGPTNPCSMCMAPALMIDAGAVVQSKKGDRISMPLVLANMSPAGRPIWVKYVGKIAGGAEEAIALDWEQVEAGSEQYFTVDLPPRTEGGQHSLKLNFVIASRYRGGIEECYAFSTTLSISVAEQSSSNSDQLNIRVEGGTGTLVNVNKRERDGDSPTALTDRRALKLGRAEKYELDRGLRGYKPESLRVPRTVEFTFTGFKSTDAPANGSLLGPRGRLICGRNSRTPDPIAQATPSDVCLRAYDGRTGDVDEPATLAISRHHFDLVVINDRLCLQARATGGLEVNGHAVAAGEIRPLRPGDRVVPIPGRADKLALQIAFATAIDSVDRINLTRTPITR